MTSRLVQRFWWPALIFGLTLLALAIRLPHRSGAIGFDEWVTITLAQQPWDSFWRYLQFENTPPLFFVLAKFWGTIVPNTEAWFRSLALIFGVASVPCMAILSRRLVGAVAGVGATLFLVFSTVPLVQSYEYRTYSLTIFLTLVSLLAFDSWRRSARTGWLLLLTLTATLGIVSHVQFVLVVGTLWTLFLSSPTTRRHWRPWFLAWVLPAIALGAWLWLVWLPHQEFITEPIWITSLATTRWTQLATWIGTILPLTHAGLLPLPYLVLTGVLLYALVLYGLHEFIRHRSARTFSGRLPLTLWGFGVIVAIIANIDRPKYFAVSALGLFIFLAWSWRRLPGLWLKWVFGLAFVGILVFQPGYSYVVVGYPWPDTARYLEIEAQSQDLVLLHPFADAETLRYYYRGLARIDGVLPTRFRGNDHLADVLQYNFQQVVTPVTYGDLQFITGDASRVFYISTQPDRPEFFRGDLPLRWFREHGWAETPLIHLTSGDPFMTRFDRPAANQ